MNAQNIFEELIHDFVRTGMPIKPQKIEKKLQFMNTVTKLGKCKWDGSRYTVYLSKNAMKSEEQVRKTLAHELVHTLPDCMNHGPSFFKYGKMVEKRLGIEVNSKADRKDSEESGIQEAYREKARFLIRCKACGEKIYRQRICSLTEEPQRYRCSKCRGELEVFHIQEIQNYNKLSHLFPSTDGDEKTSREKPQLHGLEYWHRYAVACESCGQVYGRKSMSAVIKNPEKYRCQCKGKLVRIM